MVECLTCMHEDVSSIPSTEGWRKIIWAVVAAKVTECLPSNCKVLGLSPP